jgi:hypothetical protein
MSPPGKKAGETTYESVVRAILELPIGRMAESVRDERKGFPRCLRKVSLMRDFMSFPPLP